ncbi:MAG: ABC transporter substrate-binding protein [Rhodoglobus sp.]
MKNITRPLLAFVAVGALALTGCSAGGGSSDEPSVGGLPMTVSTEFSTQVDKAAADLLPQDVLDRGKIRIAVAVPYPPFVAYGDNDKIIGVDVDMVAALSAKLGIPFEINHQVFESVIPSLQSDRHDVIMMGMNDSQERQGTLNFVEEIKAGFAIVVEKGNPENITTLMDLCGLSVSTQKSTVQAQLLEDLEGDCIAAGFEGIDVQGLPVAQDSQTALRAGRVQAYVVDAPVAAFTVATAGDGEFFDMIADPKNPQGFNPVYTGFALLKDRTELTDALQAAMQALMDEGIYQSILDTHGMGSLALDEALVNAATN